MNESENVAEILISKCGEGYTADLDHPCRVGSPSVGTGKTKVEAIAALFIRLTVGEFVCIKKSKILKINGIPWQDIPKSSRR